MIEAWRRLEISPSPRAGLGRSRGWIALAAVVLSSVTSPAPAAAQLTSPCELECALVLGTTGFVVGTGALVARGRYTGGVSSLEEVIGFWGGGFLVFVGSGVALSGDGARQERAVYSAGIGAVAGSLAWLAVESSLDTSTRARKVAASVMGAALGAVIGGLYGALSHDSGGARATTPVGLSIPF